MDTGGTPPPIPPRDRDQTKARRDLSRSNGTDKSLPAVTARQQASRKIVAGHPAGMLRESGRQHRSDDAVAWGITTSRLRDWHKGRHPGCNLAARLHDKA